MLRLKAREMRSGGESIRIIAKQLGISKSTVSLWCRDIVLTKEQINTLVTRKSDRLKLGQLLGPSSNRNKKLRKVRMYQDAGFKRFEQISNDEFFTAGLALYLAEGSKKWPDIKFINSDPAIIRFIIRWLKKFFKIRVSDITFAIIINEIHRPRELVVKKFWCQYLAIPLSQFRKTSFVKARQRKVYENHENYYGTLHFRVLKSRDTYYRIMGLINGLLKTDKYLPA